MRVNKIIPFIISTQAGVFFDSFQSQVSLVNSYEYGYFDEDYPLGGDVNIITVGALNTSCSKVRHKDDFPPIFTTDSPVTINIITDSSGTTRVYSSSEPLPEYVLGVVNEIYIVRDNNVGAVSSIDILILQP